MLQLFPFLLLLPLSLSLLLSFLFSYYLFYFQFIITYFIKCYYFTIFLFYFSFVYSFLILSSFLFHFLHLFTFFAIFVSLCASNESIKCFICMLLFLILSPLAFCKYYKKNAKIIRTIGKTQVPFAFVVVLLLVLSWTIHFIHHLYISHNAPFLPSKIFQNLCFSFILGITAVPRETENND